MNWINNRSKILEFAKIEFLEKYFSNFKILE